MEKSRACTAVDCSICGKTISRKADLPRHTKTHSTNKEELMHTCPHEGCAYRALQRSNLITHLNVHSRERPNKCPAEGCEFSTSDPGSLTRHRKERHGYEPKGNSSGSHPSANPRKAARQRRRNTPYTPSSSPSVSARSLSTDPSTPSSSILLTDDHVEEASKNASAAYSTEFITKRAQANDSVENAPLNLGSSTASEAPAAEHPQLPVPEQGDRYAVDPTVQPVSEVSNSSLAQFNDWQSAVLSLSMPMVLYSVDDVPVPTPTSLPLYAVDDTYIPTPAALPPYAVDNAHIPTPAFLPPYAVDEAHIPTPASLPPYTVDIVSTPAFLPPYYAVDDAPVPPSASQSPYEVQSIVDNASYEYYDYTTEAVSFDAQLSQPALWATPDMGVYPQDGNQVYATYAGTSNFAMHGLYVN